MTIGLLQTRSLIPVSITDQLRRLRRGLIDSFARPALLRLKVQAKADLSTFGNSRFYFDRAARSMSSLLHTDKSKSRGAWRAFSQSLHIETHAVVLYRQKQNVPVFNKLQQHSTGLRVTHDVGQCFLR